MDRTGIGLIGYGYWGPNVARKIEQNRNFSFRYICDLAEERLAKARQLYREQLSYTGDYHDLLQDESVQAVAIAVNTESHYQIAKDALQAGKHVYIEKPFTSTSGQGKELQRLAEEKGILIRPACGKQADRNFGRSRQAVEYGVNGWMFCENGIKALFMKEGRKIWKSLVFLIGLRLI